MERARLGWPIVAICLTRHINGRLVKIDKLAKESRDQKFMAVQYTHRVFRFMDRLFS